MPNVFQGNPLKLCPRSHSAKLNPAASATIRPAPGAHMSRASRKPRPGKIASAAGSPTTPSGKGQGNSAPPNKNPPPKPPEPGQEIPKAPPPAGAEGAPSRDRKAQTK